MKKRMFAMLLVLTMLMTMFPATAFAETSTIETAVDLLAAVNNAPTDGTHTEITLAAGQTFNLGSEHIWIKDGMNITLNLNGGTITSSKDPYTIHISKVDTVGGAATTGKLTILGAGTIDNTSAGSTTIRNYGTLTIGAAEAEDFPTVLCINKNNIKTSAVKCDEDSTLTIYGGTFTGQQKTDNRENGYWRSVQSWGTTYIYGGTFNGNVEAWKWAEYPSVVYISGGVINGTLAVGNDAATEDGKFNITGGMFYSDSVYCYVPNTHYLIDTHKANQPPYEVVYANSLPASPLWPLVVDGKEIQDRFDTTDGQFYYAYSIASSVNKVTINQAMPYINTTATVNVQVNDGEIVTVDTPYDITLPEDGTACEVNIVITVNGTDVAKNIEGTKSISDGIYNLTITREAAPTVPVTEVKLDKTSAKLTVGKTLQLEATVVPAEATDKTVTWESSNEEVATVEDGVVTAHKVGTATITATSVDNEEVSAECVVTVEKKAASKPSTSGSTGGSSSGSSSGSTTTTEKNPDGSTTTTKVDKTTGTVTETTKGTDGSTETVKTETDGTVTTNVKAADGTKSETVVDKNGVQNSEVTVSNKAVNEAAKSGEAVALPIPEVKATTSSTKAATVTVDLPANVKTAKVEVPVANVNAGTVAVIVHADGTEEVVRNCVPTEDGIALNVANGATVKIVDNSRDFADVSAAHSFSDAVDFASARGIVEGYSNGSFGVGGYATSAATATVIARIMGEDFYGSGSTTKAQNWAKENGIAAGLDLSGNVSRVDFMTMLWRAAGNPAASTTLSFTDASSIAAGAMDAMAWAVEVGLIGGYDDGSVRPEANITRGAMAAIAQRYLMAK